MRYTVTSREEREAKVSPETILAIQSFEKVLRAEKNLKKKEDEHTGWLLEVPPEDMNVYMEVTEEMIKKIED